MKVCIACEQPKGDPHLTWCPSQTGTLNSVITNPNPLKSIDEARRWARQTRDRLSWLIGEYSPTNGWPEDADELAQLGICLAEQDRLLAVLDNPDADEKRNVSYVQVNDAALPRSRR